MTFNNPPWKQSLNYYQIIQHGEAMLTSKTHRATARLAPFGLRSFVGDQGFMKYSKGYQITNGSRILLYSSPPPESTLFNNSYSISRVNSHYYQSHSAQFPSYTLTTKYIYYVGFKHTCCWLTHGTGCDLISCHFWIRHDQGITVSG